MKVFSKLSPVAKMILGLGTIMVSILILALVSYQSMNHIHESGEKLQDSYKLTRNLSSVSEIENGLHEALLDLLISRNPLIDDTVIKQINEDYATIISVTDSVLKQVQDVPEEMALVNDLKTLVATYIAQNKEHISLLRAGKFDEVHGMAVKVEHETDEAIRSKIQKLGKMHDAHVAEIAVENNGILNVDLAFLIVIGAAVIVLALILLLWMVRMLRQISYEIKSGILILGTTAAEILSTVSEISTGATETATAISETTTTVEEVRQTAMVANQKARDLLGSSQKATDSAEKGMESVQLVIDSMKKIDKQMNVIAETVVKLSDQNRSIGEITSTVTDIADQSNLLAVNAAIEAAKAGEQGRGFAVVAQEIRSLADQSKKATVQIKEILNEIHKSVSQSVDVTEKGSQTVAEGIQLVTKSGDAIGVLAEHVEEAVQISVQISSSSQQQMAGMEQVVPAMENIRQASEQNVSGIRQAQAAANDINNLGLKIQDIIQKYNL